MMVPGAANVAQPGVVFGYRPLADFGSFSDGLGNIYKFGRSRLEEMWNRDVMDCVDLQKELLVRRVNCGGLNRPSTILLWVYTDNVAELWDRVKRHLKGNWWRDREPQDLTPIITNHLRLGDSWYSVGNMGPTDFGTWARELAKQESIEAGLEATFALSREY